MCWALGAALGGAAGGVALAAPQPGPLAGNAARGADKAADERCDECHSLEAHDAARSKTSFARFPKLAGQNPAYIAKQLHDFRSGARQHDLMTLVARGLEESDIPDLAAYFGSLARMHGEGTSDHPAAQLYLHGDPARGVPACATCHGPTGKEPVTSTPPIPVIGGQELPYLAFQLRDWRQGARTNSPGAVMHQITRPLTEPEIESLAAYLSGL